MTSFPVYVIRCRASPAVRSPVAWLTWTLLIASIACSALPARAQTTETARANAIFAEFWERFAREFPEYSTFRGDYRYNDRLSDRSPAARAAYDAKEREWLRRKQR